MFLRAFLLAGLAVSTPALAQDEAAEEADDAAEEENVDLGNLLDRIPEIKNPGQELEDEAAEAAPDVPFTTYVDQVRAAVLAAWKPKMGTIKKNPSLETRLVLVIAEDGEVTDLKPMVLSGDKKFDQGAVDAVNAAGRMPAPAPNLRTVAQEGVVVIFSARARLSGR